MSEQIGKDGFSAGSQAALTRALSEAFVAFGEANEGQNSDTVIALMAVRAHRLLWSFYEGFGGTERAFLTAMARAAEMATKDPLPCIPSESSTRCVN